MSSNIKAEWVEELGEIFVGAQKFVEGQASIMEKPEMILSIEDAKALRLQLAMAIRKGISATDR